MKATTARSNEDELVGSSPLKEGWRRLKQNRLAMASGWLLLIFYLIAIIAPVIAPYHYDDEQRQAAYHPPTPIQIRDADGNWTWPFVYATEASFDEYYRRVFVPKKNAQYPVRFGLNGRLVGVEAPARLYVLGADSRGRDLLSRIIYGSRISLSIGLIGVAISFSLGLFVGGAAGYFGGWLDDLLMRICEMIMMAPGFYLLLALRAAFPPEMSSVSVYALIVIIMSFIGWAGLARVIRGIAISLRQREYVIAARACGRPAWAIIARHILPNTASYAIVAATLSVPGYILGESALSLLGLGIQDPYASWGNLLSDAMSIAQVQMHPWMLIPGGCIFIVVMAYNFLGDGLRDALDPKQNFIKQ